ncbi:hypothetical protein A1O3_07809 [Capronia epimyces CBS 606.96]|uniref:HpcH/HpaI aldolase/citrate lyase domain-containing protein n=1 Tax=Capronia epimyces CBS 606.96 TaxID=1182542 RepID=W9XQD0_9EURO|nr:uncharacterized protein A1O3_07809 [Capronia epimyces CBS 606.96]EXJ79530.1 hypothetical protein A1O3_07809 [Capronia epimyces CBS 606.96]
MSIVSTSGKTRLRAALERAAAGGRPCIGQWMEFPGFSLSRTIAALGEDWVLIDCEHGNIADADMYLAVAAIASAGASPIVRVPASEPWLFKRALDCGAHGLLIPMCETREQAEMIANACRYPNAQNGGEGFRGAGAMFAPAYFQQDGRAYIQHANENITVIVQIETKKAVENVEEIAAVEGIDGLFVGPNDLAASMGFFPLDHGKHDEVQEATARVLAVGKKAGKFVGHFAESAAFRINQGFDFVNCGADIVAITSWMSSEMGKLAKLVKDKEHN